MTLPCAVNAQVAVCADPGFLEGSLDFVRARFRVRCRPSDEHAEIFPIMIAWMVLLHAHWATRNAYADVPQVDVILRGRLRELRQHMILISEAYPGASR